jgi:hypothetical protein
MHLYRVWILILRILENRKEHIKQILIFLGKSRNIELQKLIYRKTQKVKGPNIYIIRKT